MYMHINIIQTHLCFLNKLERLVKYTRQIASFIIRNSAPQHAHTNVMYIYMLCIYIYKHRYKYTIHKPVPPQWSRTPGQIHTHTHSIYIYTIYTPVQPQWSRTPGQIHRTNRKLHHQKLCSKDTWCFCWRERNRRGKHWPRASRPLCVGMHVFMCLYVWMDHVCQPHCVYACMLRP